MASETIVTPSFDPNLSTLILGAHNNPAQSSNTLRILDEVGIWNRALDSTEVMALFLGDSPIFGCGDPEACNFDAEATSDDGSCQYPVQLAPELMVTEDHLLELTVGEWTEDVVWSDGSTAPTLTATESGTYAAQWTAVTSTGIEQAADLSETGAWISISSLELPSEYTLQVWAKFPLPTTDDGYNTFFSDWNSGGSADLVHLYFHGTCGLGLDDQYQAGNCGFSGAYGTGLLASDVTEGWHLISAVSTPSGTSFYLDADAVGTVAHQVTGPILALGNNAGGNGVAGQQSGIISQALFGLRPCPLQTLPAP